MQQRPLIAIDATAVPPRPAGAGRYTLSLIHALSRVDRQHDYVVYARSHSLPELQGLAPAFTVADVGALSRGKRYVWEQTGLPMDLRRRGARLLHSPHHTTPLLCPCPRVVTVHDVTFFLLPQRYPASRRYFFQVATRLSVLRAAAVIVPSHSAASDLDATLHPPAAKVHVTYEGVDAAFQPADEATVAALRERYGLPPGYLLSLGTLEPGKNRAVLVEALRRLAAAGRDVHLAVAGQSGWGDDPSLSDATLTGRVHRLGYVPQADLPALYSGASVFVFPSLHEGFGLPVLEAMACGTPVVTSDRSSLPEVADDAALLVDPTDAAALTTAVASLLDDGVRSSRLRESGIERAKGFSWDACATATLQVYRRVLNET